jgi:hypothetical protein
MNPISTTNRKILIENIAIDEEILSNHWNTVKIHNDTPSKAIQHGHFRC